MCLSSILRKFMRKGENPAGFQDRGSAYGVQPPNGNKKPFQAVGDDHGGDYIPQRNKVTSSDRNIDHGGDYIPRRNKATSSDRNIDRRLHSGPRDTRFLNPKDGRPKKLIVQCSNEELVYKSGADWSRIPVKNIGPWMFRIAHWAVAGGDEAYIRWLPACAALTLVLFNPFPVTTTVQNNGFYEPVPYRDWQYPYDARNQYENPPSRSAPSRPLIGHMERISEPAYLCLIDGKKGEKGEKIINVRKWRKENGADVDLKYVMISYTRKHFITNDDLESLHDIGQRAAVTARVGAYWLGCSCLGPASEQEENVWRISDVIRGAYHLVIVVAGPMGVEVEGKVPDELLNEWGDRVWTLPELLLSPERNDISVYTLNRSLDPTLQLEQCLNTKPVLINRRNFSRFWEDDTTVGQLMDHYEGSVTLGPLELITTALKCLGKRHTTQHLPGDLSYSLMGLLRQRPNAHKDDSSFQAFARLSLANDSNMLLERLICLLPPNPYAPWYTFQDHWDASLWDIYSRTQVCGIGDNDTVILDGARAATIRWKKFKKVMLRGNPTVMRSLAVIALTLVSPVFIIAIVILGISRRITAEDIKDAVLVPGYLLLVLSLILILMSPWLIHTTYLGKVWGSQPWFFGIEGYMPLHEVEKHLFGVDLHRLSWSTTASSLSKHDYFKLDNELTNYYEGQDPRSNPEVDARIKKALRSTGTQERIFTLVDTYTMTVTLFAAVKPPVAVLVCGEEGGMQRALLCSYDWTDNTLYRETVLRMETHAYWKMSPIRRVRLGLQTRAKKGLEV
ncbi:MAG: hypothetical protein Q9172_002768 [Xanthocarpia lactea]